MLRILFEIVMNHFTEKKEGKLSHRQIQRAKKRLLKPKQNKNAKKSKNDAFKEHSFDENDKEDSVIKNNKRQLTSDNNALQPKPKKIKKLEKIEPKLQLFKNDNKDKGLSSAVKAKKKLRAKKQLNSNAFKLEEKEKKPKIRVEKFIEESDEETGLKNVDIFILVNKNKCNIKQIINFNYFYF